MRTFKLYIFLLLINFNLKAQNLVPNGSFEIKDTSYPCPMYFGDLPISCINWNYTEPSTDCFDSCANSLSTGIPINTYGEAYQLPHSGSRYGGFILMDTGKYSPYIYNEYLITKLSSKLKKSSYYKMEFYYSISEYREVDFFDFNTQTILYVPYNSISIGVYFTNTKITRQLKFDSIYMISRLYPLKYKPQVINMTPSNFDAVSWFKFEGIFHSMGGEEYITIGHFIDSTTNLDWTYLYVDDISLTWIGEDTILPLDSMIIPNVFTPNGDGYNDFFKYIHQEQWQFETYIFNRWGNLIFENKTSENWDGYYKGNKVSAGVYFYIIKAKAIKTGDIVIYKGSITVIYN